MTEKDSSGATCRLYLRWYRYRDFSTYGTCRGINTQQDAASLAAPKHMPRGEVVGRTGAVERSYEHLALPRKGTQCALLAREVLVAASEAGPAIQRLRFAWPSTFEGPPPCCEGSDGVVHVHVRAPALDGSFSEKLSRSVPRIAQLPLFVVLIEQSQKLSQAPAVQPHIDGRRRVRARYQDPHRQTRGLGVSGGA